jgi:hypothetical protein
MSSDNPNGADNQQETECMLELDPRWIVGFVDGEGCFSVSLHHNPRFARRSFGWQVHPTFQVYQHRRHRAVLEAMQAYFACGTIRAKGPASNVLTYAVDSLVSLEAKVVPFFEQHAPIVKASNFAAFADIVRSLRRKEHFTAAGFERLVRLAYSMNEAGKQRARPIEEILLGSSETARQAALL